MSVIADRDWPRVRQDYIEGVDGTWPTLLELSTKYDIPYARVRERSMLGKWTAEKQTYMRRTEAARQHARIQAAAQHAARLDELAMSAATNGLEIIVERITALREQQPDDNRTETGDGEIERLSRAAMQWYALGTRALGKAPTTAIELIGEEDEIVDADDRDTITEGVLGILLEHNLVPAEIAQVIDVNSRLRLVTGDSPSGDGGGAGTAAEPVSAEDVDGPQHEPEATSVPQGG